jgi:SAM-dependent methyltransferase
MTSAHAAAISRHSWYHKIELGPGITTPGDERFVPICDFIARQAADISFRGKTVLDVGTRDCLHALRSERCGAARILAIDNDLSAGARDLVLPHFGSSIELREQNLYDLQERDAFDIVQLFGVLYHLREPFRGLRTCVDALHVGGILLIETGAVVDPAFEHMELLWCPGEDSNPYDPSSCSFFNECGMNAALASMGCVPARRPAFLDDCSTTDLRFNRPTLTIRRGFFVYEKRAALMQRYWYGTHDMHTRGATHADWRSGSS